jgi:hypothetical protein
LIIVDALLILIANQASNIDGTGPDIMAQLKPFEGDDYLWRYVPSRAAAIVFVVLFAIPTGFVIWRIVKTRSWHCIPFAIGGLCKSTLQ